MVIFKNGRIRNVLVSNKYYYFSITLFNLLDNNTSLQSDRVLCSVKELS